MALAVTDHAAAVLKETLDAIEHEDAQILRLVPGATDHQSGHLGLALDRTREGDQVVVYEGLAVLAVEKDLSEFLSTSTLDVEEGAQGRQLILTMTSIAKAVHRRSKHDVGSRTQL